jgi:two-component system chemotaxis response regulator CheY
MRILAIDDTRTLRALLVQTLRAAGHEVVEAENGEEGLVRFDEHDPEVVITDLNMPVLDGIEFTRACRTRPKGQDTPIIILTTESAAELKAEGRRAGATAWMVKPFEPNVLLGLIDQVGPERAG